MITPRRVAWAAVLVYAAALAVGWVAVEKRGAAAWTRREPAQWLAAHDLRAMEQVDSADLAAPSGVDASALPPQSALLGKHLSAPRARNAPITARNVAELRVGAPPTGAVRFVLAARPAEVPLVSLALPGDTLSACVANAPPAGASIAWDCAGPPFTVVAIHRPAAAAEALWAVLETRDEAQATRLTGAAHRLLIRRP